MQYGPTRAAWWTLQDAGGDVVAVCDLSGSGSTARVCGQWRYDAYGAATAAEHLFAFPAVRCGHKALFFDRLDSASADSLGNEPPRLIPFAHLVVQMRNRAYMPQLGRFLQPDPNATALTLIEATSFHGRGMGALVAAFDVQALYGDGMNLYEYLGSSPWGRRDPLGLFFFGVDDAIMLGFHALRGGLENMIAHYSANMESDLDWALDWDQGDDWHSRSDNSWVAQSFAAGMRGGFQDALEDMFYVDEIRGLTGLAMAGGYGGAASRGAKATRRFNMVRGRLPGLDKTWRKHGAPMADELIQKAINTKGKDQKQGWFTNKVQLERFLSRLDYGRGGREVALPRGLGKVALSDGRIVNATRARIVVTSIGRGPQRLDHAYPMP